MACSEGGGSGDAPSIAPESAETTTTTIGADGTPPPRTSYVAQARGKVKVWKEANSSASSTLASEDEGSGLLTFLVVDRGDDGWLEVLLPTAPLGSTGFIRADDVFVSRHRYRIEVSLSRFELVVYAGPLEAAKTPIAVGPDAPKAGTSTYIKELRAPEFMTIYGSPVYGLAGAPNTAEQFKAGTGVVAIHPVGTTVLGKPMPAGSIGVDPALLSRLTTGIDLPLGTPVDIVE